ncbi:hypothetical protein F2Q69_00030929 [Brassica cretica]|uniref:Uncharacterized protein n=1 Tax=Brassica cretica TaxID=69181 RepID=A0A8S9S4J6_BRACR|nr:hypothetical protein F2Q69_00030929 [Brassica cretica]
MTPALCQSDLSQRGSVPALGPTSHRQLSRTRATKTERGGYVVRQIHGVRRKPERPRRSEVGTSYVKSMECEGSQSDIPERGGDPAVKLERPTKAGSRTHAQDLYLVNFSCFAGPSQTCF